MPLTLEAYVCTIRIVRVHKDILCPLKWVTAPGHSDTPQTARGRTTPAAAGQLECFCSILDFYSWREREREKDVSEINDVETMDTQEMEGRGREMLLTHVIKHRKQ